MTRWLISVPAWGPRCVDVFCATALPALERAVLRLARRGEVDPVVVVHTDAPEQVRQAATEIRIEARPVPAGLRDFDCLSQAHREVLGMACRGDVVVLLTADLVISAAGLEYCRRALATPQKMLVACAGVRALQEGRIPGTESAPDLMRWAWENRHPITQACSWPDGDSADLSRVYFEKDGAVCSRLALPHPLAVEIDGRPLKFTPTIDANLIQCFDPIEVHMATDCRELALVELSPRDKDYGRHPVPLYQRVANGGFAVGDPLQRWCMRHPMLLVGDPASDCGDSVLDRTLADRTEA